MTRTVPIRRPASLPAWTSGQPTASNMPPSKPRSVNARGARLGQIGILGWTVVVPTLLGLVLGHWLDRYFGTRVFFSAPLLMVGAGVGLWSAWKWMHRQTRRK
jgi:predicted F0F1-ATPase subunit